MTTPRLGAPELTAGQAAPETTVNEQIRYVEQGAGHFSIKDRDLATPPGSPADGDRYIVASSPTGAWAANAGDIAFYMNTGWEFINITEGMSFWIEDENKFLVATSASTFQEFASSATLTVTSQSGTAYTAVLADGGTYIRFTSASAVTFTIPPNSSVAFPTGTKISFEQAAAGTVTATAGAGVTISSRGSVFGTAGANAVATLVKVATDTWILSGDIA